MQKDIIQALSKSLLDSEIKSVKKEITSLLEDYSKIKQDYVEVSFNGTNEVINKNFILTELKQISETRTIERTHYYIKRLIKSLSEIKQNKINDLNLNRWKEYEDIITDSLWLLDRRDKSGAHNAGYWGNFIPQIPNQLLRRYTKKGDWVLDPFLGSGTTLIESARLGRNCIGIELQPSVAKLAKQNFSKESSSKLISSKIITGNSASVKLKKEIAALGINTVQFVMLHPPYWDIIKFSKNKNDLSNAESADKFLELFNGVIDNTIPHLEKGRFFAIIIGDKYSAGEWIPLGFYVMNEMIKKGYRLKSTIIKNFEETKGKMNQKELWRYRALAGGFYIFKHEYIFLFQK